MRLSTPASALLTTSVASSANINLTNNCTVDVYVSYGNPMGNSAPIQVSGGGGTFTQPIGTTSGQLLKLDTSADETNPLQFNWTPGQDNNTYVGIAEVGNSPLVQYANAFVPSTGSNPPANCYAVYCAAGADACYHQAGGPTCPIDDDWEITLCACSD